MAIHIIFANLKMGGGGGERKVEEGGSAPPPLLFYTLATWVMGEWPPVGHGRVATCGLPVGRETVGHGRVATCGSRDSGHLWVMGVATCGSWESGHLWVMGEWPPVGCGRVATCGLGRQTCFTCLTFISSSFCVCPY